ncbi:unnamed protein product [Ostreobium quekettii]|uniref:Mannosyl-oligosaccharide glucosidase n=1 Tax=Ostreobium quekettii TaxID=121088 RepID=A0A8S1IYA9_9CHLO|nr:unnamed protein product [Ostreobium quekettii]
MAPRRRRPGAKKDDEGPGRGLPSTAAEPAPGSGLRGGALFLLVSAVLASAVYYLRGGIGSEVGVLSRFQAPLMTDLAEFDDDYRRRMLWGTYRPGLYFGLRTRLPKSLLTGLAWFQPASRDAMNSVRHLAGAPPGATKFGWLRHDGANFGIQEVVDGNMTIKTSWVKHHHPESGIGGDWSVRVSAWLREGAEPALKHVPFIFYIADEHGPDMTTGILGLRANPDGKPTGRGGRVLVGRNEDLGDWSLYLQCGKDTQWDLHSTGLPLDHYHNVTEMMQGLVFMGVQQQLKQQREGQSSENKVRLVIPDGWWAGDGVEPNAAFFQVDIVLPGEFEFVFLSGQDEQEARLEALTGSRLTSLLESHTTAFSKRFEETFGVGDAADVPADFAEVSKRALSNMLGGIGYFYGSSRVALEKNNPEKVREYGPSELFTSVPSRSFFPRGFLWDEGFHQLMIRRWDPQLSRDILAHWLDLMNSVGWIPREQILGEEARARVPDEFVDQQPTVGNPPTLFLPFLKMAKGLTDPGQRAKEQADREFLSQAYPRLCHWYDWFLRSQGGPIKGSFRWTARDATVTKELNPKTLDSGLDDFPRASHPSSKERHLDLRCWMALAAEALATIGEALDMPLESYQHYRDMSEELRDLQLLNALHLDTNTSQYLDFGMHTDDVQLEWVCCEYHGEERGMEKYLARKEYSSPEPRLVPHFGYPSLFPLFLHLFDAGDPMLSTQIDLLRNPDLLWSDHGLRSLAKTSPFYGQKNTPDDPPYWRGAVWINMNFLALRSLHHYGQLEGPYKAKAREAYAELKRNVLQTVVGEYLKSGYIWEQYDDVTGYGKGCHPFTGWSALFILIGRDAY